MMSRLNEKNFDVVILNPPFQTKSDAKHKKTQPIWPKFIEKAFEVCKGDGYVTAIHPSGWRGAGKTMKKVGNLLKSKQMEYLEIHDVKDGQKTFGAATRYDWYVVKNCDNNGLTTIKDEDGVEWSIGIREMHIIPNAKIERALSLIAKDNEETVNVLYSASAYETRKKHMSKVESEEYCHPCIYIIKKSGPTYWYSNTNANGHFGVPKVVFTNGVLPTAFLDDKGKCGLTQFAYGIVDDVDVLPQIQEVLLSDEFAELAKSFKFSVNLYDHNIFKLFRKDFWKEFIKGSMS